MITEYGANIANGSLRTCYDSNGTLYCLPIYVINPPSKFGTKNTIDLQKNSNINELDVYLYKMLA